MKTTNDDCVGISGNTKRFGRGETHESKQRQLYIYQRAAPSLSLCSAYTTSCRVSNAPQLLNCSRQSVCHADWEKNLDTRRWLCAGGKHTATCDRVTNFLTDIMLEMFEE
jgi:hypothetical protein